MKVVYSFVLFLLLATAPAAAQLTVTGNATKLTVDGSSGIKAGAVNVSGGATIDLKGANSFLTGIIMTIEDNSFLVLNGLNSSATGAELNALTRGRIDVNGLRSFLNTDKLTIGPNSRVNMTGDMTHITADEGIYIREDAFLNAAAQNLQIETNNIEMGDGSEFSAPSYAGEIFVYENFKIDDGSIFTVGSYVECTDIDWNGETIFLIGGDESAGNYAHVLGQGSIRLNGQVTTDLTDGYEPTDIQRYRLIELDDQFTEAGFSSEAPGVNWSYDIEQDYVDIIFDASGLPVEWLSFTGQWVDKTAQLNWQTATESGSGYFDVERHNMTGGWQAIGQVAAAGESLTPMSYDFLDGEPGAANPILYRLRQVDLDGSFTYSEVISLARRAAEGDITLYPNPARDYLFVEGLPAGTFTITDVAGREVARGQAINETRLRLKLPANLPMGTYILRSGSGVARRFTVAR